jgi:hypothetical protein
MKQGRITPSRDATEIYCDGLIASYRRSTVKLQCTDDDELEMQSTDDDGETDNSVT